MAIVESGIEIPHKQALRPQECVVFEPSHGCAVLNEIVFGYFLDVLSKVVIRKQKGDGFEDVEVVYIKDNPPFQHKTRSPSRYLSFPAHVKCEDVSKDVALSERPEKRLEIPVFSSNTNF
jgi:hypothetical protein